MVTGGCWTCERCQDFDFQCVVFPQPRTSITPISHPFGKHRRHSMPPLRIANLLQDAGACSVDLHPKHLCQRRSLHMSLFAIIVFGFLSFGVLSWVVEWEYFRGGSSDMILLRRSDGVDTSIASPPSTTSSANVSGAINLTNTDTGPGDKPEGPSSSPRGLNGFLNDSLRTQGPDTTSRTSLDDNAGLDGKTNATTIAHDGSSWPTATEKSLTASNTSQAEKSSDFPSELESQVFDQDVRQQDPMTSDHVERQPWNPPTLDQSLENVAANGLYPTTEEKTKAFNASVPVVLADPHQLEPEESNLPSPSADHPRVSLAGFGESLLEAESTTQELQTTERAPPRDEPMLLPEDIQGVLLEGVPMDTNVQVNQRFGATTNKKSQDDQLNPNPTIMQSKDPALASKTDPIIPGHAANEKAFPPVPSIVEQSETIATNPFWPPRNLPDWVDPRGISMRANDPVYTALDQPQRTESCWNDRDTGMIHKLQTTARHFCHQQQAAQVTRIAHFSDSSADLKATVFNNLEIDLREVQISGPIPSLALDGGNHDPRFRFHKQLIQCECEEVRAELFSMISQTIPRQPIDFWTSIFAQQNDPLDASSHCLKDAVQQQQQYSFAAEQRASFPMSANNQPLQTHSPVEFHENVVLIARKDDHNPFFQISATLNAWILLQVVGWDVTRTRLLLLDAGYDTPTDELQRRLLAPNHEMVRGSSLQGQRVHFNQVLVAPFETSGPMIAHLNDVEPCLRNELILRFRQEAMQKFGVSLTKADPNARCLVTVISRRVYQGRNVQRKWLNEDEILRQMRVQYGGEGGAGCVFQSVEFVDLTMAQQMEIIRDSDVVIGMHGAGLVNVMWTRPGTMVIEIFPRRRRRWGYRNLCQFVGCDWHEFRGGRDTGFGDNASDKTIPWYEWEPFFGPLLQSVLLAKQTIT